MEESLETRTQTVNQMMGRWEALLTARLKEQAEMISALEATAKVFRWRRWTLVLTALSGMLIGTSLLVLSLSLPGVNKIMYRLLLLWGR